MNGMFSRRSPIGLDIGAHCVKAVQSVPGKSGRSIVACTRFPRLMPDTPISPAELTDVRAILRRQGFSGFDVVIAANNDKVLTGAVELPARRPDVPMDQIARAEFSRIQKCDLATAEFAWWELPTPARGGKGTHVMAVAYPHGEANSQLAVYDQAGFRVRAIETPAVALGRTCLVSAPGHATVAAVDLGWRSATIVLMRSGVVAYERRNPAGGLSKLHAVLAGRLRCDAQVAEQIVSEIGLTGEVSPEAAEMAEEARPVIAGHLDAVAEEVRKACGYVSHQYPEAPVTALVVAGGGACIAGVIDYLAAALKIQVLAAEPGTVQSRGRGQRPAATSSHASAAGLAAHLD